MEYFSPSQWPSGGTYNITDYCWNREGQPISYLPNGAIKRHYVGTLEASAMMLEWYSYTGDRKFLDEALPFIEEVVEWWDKHYPRDKEGKIEIAPGNALEAYGEVTNPATDVSGMQRVLDQLLALPQDVTGAEKLANWRRLRGEVPALPRGTVNGKAVLLPSKESVINGHETPELYSVFPFRLIGPGSDDLAIARNTYDLQPAAAFFGWYQEPVFAAGLGLAEEARQHVAWRYAIHNADSRFPAFWGPNYDWTPDQDHGGVANIAMQMMLLQTQGDKLLLFPAWPKEWDVDFKLRAPDKTTVHAVYRNGKVEKVEVSPKRRLKDVVIVEPAGKK